ncbi:hypothetical protein ACFC0X_24965 [Paenibacillus chitinolyticus]|uniref:hypothetical protein n=1 Tax=Paenibacillus chitinolyticus TaxID=79263 RepID=UPI0035DF9304
MLKELEKSCIYGLIGAEKDVHIVNSPKVECVHFEARRPFEDNEEVYSIIINTKIIELKRVKGAGRVNYVGDCPACNKVYVSLKRELYEQ